MTDTLLLLGRTVLEFEPARIWPGIRLPGFSRVLISGGAATPALAAALNRQEDTRIICATNLGSGLRNRVHDYLLKLFRDCGIEVFSLPNAPVNINLHDKRFDKFTTEATRLPSLVFDPAAIPGVGELIEGSKVKATVMIGGAAVFGESAEKFLQTAADLKQSGSLIVLDPNPRSDMDPNMCDRWASLADIIKIGHTEANKGYLKIGKAPKEIARRLIDKGTALVCYTRGDQGCALFWKDSGELRSVDIPAREKLKLALPVGGGDAFDVALAQYCMKHGLTPQKIRENLTAHVEAMGKFANEAAANFLRARNGMGSNNIMARATRYIYKLAPTKRTIRQVYPNYGLQ